MADARIVWGALWRSNCALKGQNSHIINNNDCVPALFRTRHEAREFIDKEYGYIRHRRDLREEPHGWRIPVPVRLKVSSCLPQPRQDK